MSIFAATRQMRAQTAGKVNKQTADGATGFFCGE